MPSPAVPVALITGASSGIGRATALRLASLGMDVSLIARTVAALQQLAREIESLGRRALVVPTDVTDQDQVRKAVEQTVEQLGRMDVLVCSAGVSIRDHFERTNLDTIERVLRVNFFGTLYATHYALPHLRASRGSLIAVSSLIGKRGAPTYATYAASKFAVEGLFESLRIELAPYGIHVGIFSPGHVATPLRERVWRGDGQVWQTAPPQPFRIWPVEKCVDRIVGLIQKRRRQALLPGFVGVLLGLDRLLGPWLGDWIIGRQFAKVPLPDYPGGATNRP